MAFYCGIPKPTYVYTIVWHFSVVLLKVIRYICTLKHVYFCLYSYNGDSQPIQFSSKSHTYGENNPNIVTTFVIGRRLLIIVIDKSKHMKIFCWSPTVA